MVTCGPFVQPGDWGEPTAWNLWEAKQAKKEADLVIAEAEMKGERIIHHAHSRLFKSDEVIFAVREGGVVRRALPAMTS